MVKVDVRFACGHEDIISLVGKKAVIAEKKLELEAGDCPICYTSKLEQQIEQKQVEADEQGWEKLSFKYSDTLPEQLEKLEQQQRVIFWFEEQAEQYIILHPSQKEVVQETLLQLKKSYSSLQSSRDPQYNEAHFHYILNNYMNKKYPEMRTKRLRRKTQDFLNNPHKFGMSELKGYSQQIKLATIRREYVWRSFLYDLNRIHNKVNEDRLHQLQQIVSARFWLSTSIQQLREYVTTESEMRLNGDPFSDYSELFSVSLPTSYMERFIPLEGASEIVKEAEQIRVQLVAQLLQAKAFRLSNRQPENEKGTWHSVGSHIDMVMKITDAQWFRYHGRIPTYQVINELNRVRNSYRSGVPSVRSIAPVMENIIVPEQENNSLPITLTVQDQRISVELSDYKSALHSILKHKFGMDYKYYQYVWYVNKELSGRPVDRAAEIALELLHCGYRVHCSPKELYEKVINGNIQKHQNKWLRVRTKGKYSGYFALQWNPATDDLYHVARKISGSKWDAPYIVFPTEEYQEIQDFCTMFDVKISDQAQTLLEQAEKEHQYNVRKKNVKDENEC